MCNLNALGGFNFNTERVPSWGYPIRVLWCNHSSHSVAFTESARTHPTPSVALVNSKRARIFPRMCWSLLCQCRIAVVKTIHDAIPQLTRAQHTVLFSPCARGSKKHGARGMCHFCHISPLAKHTNPAMFFTAVFFNGNAVYTVWGVRKCRMPICILLGNLHNQAN